MSSDTRSHKAQVVVELLAKKLTRPLVASLVSCVHCGMCHEACHYALADPSDPRMTPSYKGDQLRKIFKHTYDWTGRVAPWWVGAKTPLTDEDLETLKEIAFGTCTNCRRCTFNCPMGVDTATINRTMRGLLTAVGVMPEGVRVVSKDQWEIGNQMGVLKEDYLETLEWLSEELVAEVGDPAAAIPIDKKGAKVVYAINPREVKYDPRTITNAALIFYAAGEDWTMASDWWDQTNFGLFSGDDQLGGTAGRRLFERVAELGAEKLVISECGHGYRSTRCEAQNWAGVDVPFVMESAVITMTNYIKEGRITVDRDKNAVPVTYHDSCNLARSCGITEEPRELLRLVVRDFREMTPNRQENFCCTGGGGAMSMSEYTPRRLKSAVIKAKQIADTGAKIVATSCHNCVDGLSDLIKYYKLGCQVKQLVDLTAEALVLEECAVRRTPRRVVTMPEPLPEVAPALARTLPLAGRTVLVVDDEEDARTFIATVLEDAGARIVHAADGDEALAVARRERPDLITLDLSMPGKDGVEAFTELRRDPELSTTPVCIVTGHPEFRTVIYDRPVNPPEGYMDKPVEGEALLKNVRRILETAHAAA